MVHINLLPWRAELRKQKRKDFIVHILLSVASMVLVMFSVHFHISRMIDHQGRRNEFLQSEIRVLDQKIKEIQDLDTKKRRLIARMEVIQELQISRPETVHLFDAMARAVPDGVTLLDLTQTDQKLVVNGVAQSNARVSAYLRNLESSKVFARPVLNVIQTKGDKDSKMPPGQQFTLQVEHASQKTTDIDS